MIDAPIPRHAENSSSPAISVLGIPHPAVNTRDVALYQPFRNALRSPNQVIGLQTLTWHLMRRRCQDGQLDPVRWRPSRPALFRDASRIDS